MHRIDSDGHENNRFVDEDANQAIQGTTLAADWLNALQEELINILIAAEIDPNKASNDQLALAFQLLGGSKEWEDILNKPATFPASSHTHSIYALLHTHPYAPTSHTHSAYALISHAHSIYTQLSAIQYSAWYAFQYGGNLGLDPLSFAMSSVNNTTTLICGAEYRNPTYHEVRIIYRTII